MQPLPPERPTPLPTSLPAVLVAIALVVTALAPTDASLPVVRVLCVLGAAGTLAGAALVRRQASEVQRGVEARIQAHAEARSRPPPATPASEVSDEAIVRETPNGLLLIDETGKVRRYNPALARLLPFWGDPLGGLPLDGIPVPELQEVLDEARRTGAMAERVATVGRRELVLRGVPLPDGAGCLGVVVDISSLRAAERARRDFVANVSHELRTPITAVVGYAESLLDDRDQLPPWSQPMLEAIDRNARRLGALIEDVLHLSKIEARKGDLELVAEPLRPLALELVSRFLDRARQKGVLLGVADGPEVEARINFEAFEHALGNLVDNAVKYTPAGGRIVVTLEERGGHAWVRVSDTGIGVALGHQERIFERFYRVDRGRSREVGGTGLGLALVKHLCLAMQAEISLTSEPGAGSTFTLRLPQ